MTAASSSTEEITTNAESSKQNQQEILEQHEVYVRPPTMQEMDDLINGNISVDDFKKNLGIIEKDPSKRPDAPQETDAEPPAGTQTDSGQTGQSGQTAPNVPVVPPEKPPTPAAENPPEPAAPGEGPQESKPSAQELIDAAVKELYGYEAELLSLLGVMKKEAVNEINMGDGSRQNLIKVGMAGLEKCYEIEVEADNKVRSVLDKLKIDLRSIGADTKIADQLWEFYADEKVNAKSYYLNKYNVMK